MPSLEYYTTQVVRGGVLLYQDQVFHSSPSYNEPENMQEKRERCLLRETAEQERAARIGLVLLCYYLSWSLGVEADFTVPGCGAFAKRQKQPPSLSVGVTLTAYVHYT